MANFLNEYRDRQRKTDKKKITGKMKVMSSGEILPARIPAIRERKIKKDAGLKGLKNVFT